MENADKCKCQIMCQMAKKYSKWIWDQGNVLQHSWSGGEPDTGWSPPNQASKEARNVSSQTGMEGKINCTLYTNIHLIPFKHKGSGISI